jgi:hypothetical protein
MKLNRMSIGAGALSLMIVPITGASAQAAEKPGSVHVQCDGQPNNVTGGETAARLLGAVTLLGLFAPPPEAPDASKRKFGAAGVAACSILLSGDKQEGNPARRLGLILGRAIHHIEARNYDAAVADVAMARREASAAGLAADPYFMRSRGRAFDLIESAALVRMGRAEDARGVSLKNMAAAQYSLFNLLGTPTFEAFIAAPSTEEEQLGAWQTHLVPVLAGSQAERLEQAGRFADAARVRDAFVEFDAEHTPETNGSVSIARAAVAHALAGNVSLASERVAAARANVAKRKADGKPEGDLAEYVELMDLYQIIETARGGDIKAARRLFAARSQWVGASLGSVFEVNRRLRTGAAPDELIGGLARDSDQLWTEQVETSRAALLAKDNDNKTLFNLIPGTQTAAAYATMSKNVWRTDKSRIVLKTKADPAKNKMELMYLPFVDPRMAMEGYVLHAALLARSRGHEGFVFVPVLTDKLIAASFRTGNRGQKGFAPDMFLDAGDVIAKLSPIIPAPVRTKG